MEFLSQKGGDILGFDRVDGRADEWLIKQLQIGLSSEDDVGGILSLPDRPMVGKAIALEERTVSLSDDIQDLMQIFHPDFIGELLGLGKVGNVQKDVVMKCVRDSPV